MAWEALAFLASLIGLFISALLIMFAKLFDFKDLEQVGKSELVFAISSVILVIILIPAVHYANSVGKSVLINLYTHYITQGGYLTYIENVNGENVVKALTLEQINDKRFSLTDFTVIYLFSVMGCLKKPSSLLYSFASLSHWFGTSYADVFMAYGMTAWALGGIGNAILTLLKNILLLELLYTLIIYAIRFTEIFALTIFLPAGIVLRAFPPTRGIGAYIIAFSLAFYLIFPFTYLLLALTSPFNSYVWEWCLSTEKVAFPSDLHIAKTSVSGSEVLLWLKANEESLFKEVFKLGDLFQIAVINVCFLPFVAFTITFTLMHLSHGLLGANLPEIGRGLIKLI